MHVRETSSRVLCMMSCVSMVMITVLESDRSKLNFVNGGAENVRMCRMLLVTQKSDILF